MSFSEYPFEMEAGEQEGFHEDELVDHNQHHHHHDPHEGDDSHQLSVHHHHHQHQAKHGEVKDHNGRGRGGHGGHGRTLSGGTAPLRPRGLSVSHRTQQVDAQKLQTELHNLDARLDRLRKEVEMKRSLPQTQPGTSHHITTAETLHSKLVVSGLQNRMTAELCQLASENRHTALRLKLELNVSPNGQDINGNTPLHLAARHGHKEAVQVLLAFRASRYLVDDQGRKAFDIAAQMGHIHLLDLLNNQTISPSPVTTPSTMEPPPPTAGGMIINSECGGGNNSFGLVDNSGAYIVGGSSRPGSCYGTVAPARLSTPPVSLRPAGGQGESLGYDGFSLNNTIGGYGGTGSGGEHRSTSLVSGGIPFHQGPVSTSSGASVADGNVSRGLRHTPASSPHPNGKAIRRKSASPVPGPSGAATTSNASFTTSSSQHGNSSKPTVDHLGLALVMMGLPARGKSFVAKRIRRYFTWSGIACKIFSFRHYRKDRFQINEASDRVPVTDQDDQICAGLCVDVNKFIKETQGIAIIDGTFSTKKRRETLVQWLKAETVCEAQDIVFLELVVNNPGVIERHIQTAVRALETENLKLVSNSTKEGTAAGKPHTTRGDGVPGSSGGIGGYKQLVDTAKFRQDYLDLIKHHDTVYETLDLKDTLTSFIKVVDGETFFLNEIEGAVITNIVYLLQNMHQHQNTIYLSCSGQSLDEVENRLGGNSKLTERGRCYAVALAEFMKAETSLNISPAATPVPQQQQDAKGTGGEAAGSARGLLQQVQSIRPANDDGALGTPGDHSSPTSTQPGTGNHSGKNSKVSSPNRLIDSHFAPAPRTIFSVIRSAQVRAIETTSNIHELCAPSTGNVRVGIAEYPALDDLNYGDCDGQTIEYIKATLPRTYLGLKDDPYHNTWPNGESLRQLFQCRLEPLIHDIQSKDVPLLIVSHKPLIQGLVCYFSDLEPKPEQAPELHIAKDTVIRVTYRGVEYIDLSERVDTLLAIAQAATPPPEASTVLMQAPGSTTTTTSPTMYRGSSTIRLKAQIASLEQKKIPDGGQ